MAGGTIAHYCECRRKCFEQQWQRYVIQGVFIMVTFELAETTSVLTDGEKRMLEKAKELPVIYDDDSPELTGKLEQAFTAAWKRVPG